MSAIREIKGRQIIDSRGNPTVEAEVTLESGAQGTCGGAVGGFDRREGSDRTARWRQEALDGQGCLEGRRQYQQGRSHRSCWERTRSTRSASIRR